MATFEKIYENSPRKQDPFMSLLGGFLSEKQRQKEEEKQKEETLAKLLPYLIQMKMVKPGNQIKVGGQGFDIVQIEDKPSASDLKTMMEIAKLKQEITGTTPIQEKDVMDWLSKNPIVTDPKTGKNRLATREDAMSNIRYLRGELSGEFSGESQAPAPVGGFKISDAPSQAVQEAKKEGWTQSGEYMVPPPEGVKQTKQDKQTKKSGGIDYGLLGSLGVAASPYYSKIAPVASKFATSAIPTAVGAFGRALPVGNMAYLGYKAGDYMQKNNILGTGEGGWVQSGFENLMDPGLIKRAGSFGTMVPSYIPGGAMPQGQFK